MNEYFVDCASGYYFNGTDCVKESWIASSIPLLVIALSLATVLFIIVQYFFPSLSFGGKGK